MNVNQCGVNLKILSSSFIQAVPLANQRYCVTKFSAVPKSALVTLNVIIPSGVSQKRVGSLLTLVYPSRFLLHVESRSFSLPLASGLLTSDLSINLHTDFCKPEL